MKFDVFSYTNRGGRDYNEDFYGHRQEAGKGVFVIADGLGGHGNGEVASELAVDYILNATRNNFKIEDNYLLSVMNGANKNIIDHQLSEPLHKNIRTTVVSAFFSQDVFKYFNVGDSRLYYFKNGCLYAQTKDHSVPQMAANLGEITPEEIRTHDDRSKLLKVLGDTDNLNIKKIESGIKIEQGDAFILCTDGFWEYVYETEMELDLVKSASPKEWCEFMCKRLLRRVTGKNDNFTILCGIMSQPVTASSWMPAFTPPTPLSRTRTPGSSRTPSRKPPERIFDNKKLTLLGAAAMIVFTVCVIAIIVFAGKKDPEIEDPPPEQNGIISEPPKEPEIPDDPDDPEIIEKPVITDTPTDGETDEITNPPEVPPTPQPTIIPPTQQPDTSPTPPPTPTTPLLPTPNPTEGLQPSPTPQTPASPTPQPSPTPASPTPSPQLPVAPSPSPQSSPTAPTLSPSPSPTPPTPQTTPSTNDVGRPSANAAPETSPNNDTSTNENSPDGEE
jgi:serine/threonine protein phosphatase PrpC